MANGLMAAALATGMGAFAMSEAAHAAPPYPGQLPCGETRAYDQWYYLANCNTWWRSATIQTTAGKAHPCVAPGSVLVTDRGGGYPYFEGVFGRVKCP